MGHKEEGMRPQLCMAHVLVGVGFALCPAMALAGGSCHDHKGQSCTKDLGCWTWQCKEVEETVYDVVPKEIKKTIKVPYIREIKEEISCKACQPVSSESLRTCPEVDYIRSAETVNVETCTLPCDSGCGGCDSCKKGCGSCGACPVCTTEPRIKTCMTRVEASRQFPVLEWQLVPQEVKIPRIYYVRDWKDEEVTLHSFEKKERTIKRKVWEKVPAPKCECESCCSSAPVESAPTTTTKPVDTGK